MPANEELVTVGVDVGGTNTDAAVIAGKSVLGFAKHVTTQDITTGVVRAIAQALNNSQNAAKGRLILIFAFILSVYICLKILLPVQRYSSEASCLPLMVLGSTP